MQGSGRQNFVFIVVSDGDQQFGVTVVNGGAQVISVSQGEFVRVTSGRRICDGRD